MAGSHQVIDVPHVAGQPSYAVRAVDAAGNIGPVRVLAETRSLGPGGMPVVSLPNTSQDPVGSGVMLGLLAAGLLGSRWRRSVSILAPHLGGDAIVRWLSATRRSSAASRFRTASSCMVGITWL